MKNVLYIGPYKDHNGFGRSSRRFLDCLSINSEINLSSRPVFYTKSDLTELPDQYSEFEENSSKNYDVVIQHGAPSMFQYNSHYGKNIGIVEIETANIRHTGYIDKINLLDEVIVSSSFSKQVLMYDGVTIPIKMVPEPYNISKYAIQYKSFFAYEDSNRPYIFYTIGQYTEKKNIKGIILSFLLEFTKEDNVKLFIKTDDYYQDHQDLEKLIQYDIWQIKRAIKKRDTPDIDIICGQLNDIDIVRLHQSGSCYINAVRADGYGPCAIESKICKKQLLNTKSVGSNTYVNSTNAYMIESELTNVYYTSHNPYKNFYICEYWYEPNISSIRSAMRMAYESNDRQDFDTDIIDQQKLYDKII
jgi:hypothetical protein